MPCFLHPLGPAWISSGRFSRSAGLAAPHAGRARIHRDGQILRALCYLTVSSGGSSTTTTDLSDSSLVFHLLLPWETRHSHIINVEPVSHSPLLNRQECYQYLFMISLAHN